MAKTENRYIRIEDWKGNVYFPESSSSSSVGGSTVGSDDASKDPTTNTGTKTDGDKVADSSANGGTAIVVTSSSDRQTLFSTYLSNIPFGTLTINARMKSSIASGTAGLVEMNTYFVDASGEEMIETLLDSVNISGDMFGTANEYVNLGMTTNFKGVATGETFLKVELVVLPDTGATIYFDQLSVALGAQAINGSGSTIDIHVEDTTVVMIV